MIFLCPFLPLTNTHYLLQKALSNYLSQSLVWFLPVLIRSCIPFIRVLFGGSATEKTSFLWIILWEMLRGLSESFRLSIQVFHVQCYRSYGIHTLSRVVDILVENSSWQLWRHMTVFIRGWIFAKYRLQLNLLEPNILFTNTSISMAVHRRLCSFSWCVDSHGRSFACLLLIWVSTLPTGEATHTSNHSH